MILLGLRVVVHPRRSVLFFLAVNGWDVLDIFFAIDGCSSTSCLLLQGSE
jgi:hypothetical protein